MGLATCADGKALQLIASRMHPNPGGPQASPAQKSIEIVRLPRAAAASQHATHQGCLIREILECAQNRHES